MDGATGATKANAVAGTVKTPSTFNNTAFNKSERCNLEFTNTAGTVTFLAGAASTYNTGDALTAATAINIDGSPSTGTKKLETGATTSAATFNL